MQVKYRQKHLNQNPHNNPVMQVLSPHPHYWRDNRGSVLEITAQLHTAWLTDLRLQSHGHQTQRYANEHSEVPTCYLPRDCLGLHAHSPSNLSVANAPFFQKKRLRNADKFGQGYLAASAHNLPTILHFLPNSGKHVEMQLRIQEI